MKKILIVLLAAVAFTIGGTVMNDEPSINGYFGAHVGDEYYWTSYGSWFIVYETHQPWPEKMIEAEWRIVPLGVLCSVLMNASLIFVVTYNAWLVRVYIQSKMGKTRPAAVPESTATP